MISNSGAQHNDSIFVSIVKGSPQCLITVTMLYQPEKAMARHSSTLAWKIPWTEEPGRLQSMGSLSRTRLSNFTFTFHFHTLEKEMATHSSVLAWRIPGMGEPGGLPSMESHKVGYDWSDLAAGLTYFITWSLPFAPFTHFTTHSHLKALPLAIASLFSVSMNLLISLDST